ncbi:hypothetical protein [Actinoplanes sp. NPDC051411]|uniref:hypothetical protein n=1 Tax=Actinoplanes sp. NPDC051411 TaxID=3155522 RepID=UPI00341E0F53
MIPRRVAVRSLVAMYGPVVPVALLLSLLLVIAALGGLIAGLTADETGKLIDALGRERPESPPAAQPRYPHVLVNVEEPRQRRPTRIDVRVPLLLPGGVRPPSLVPPRALRKAKR